MWASHAHHTAFNNITMKKIYEVSLSGVLVKAEDEAEAIGQFDEMVIGGEFGHDSYEVKESDIKEL